MNKKTLEDYNQMALELDDLEKELKKEKELFEQTVMNLKQKIDTRKKNLEAPKKDIEEEAKKEFKETGNKKLLGGIGIREKSKLIYDDKEAFEWAKESGTCLSLDRKKFEKVALEMTDFTKKEKVIQVTFPKFIKFED